MALSVLVFSLPYAYYQLMSWVVIGAALVVVWQAYKRNMIWVAWLFALVAVVFNPLAPIYLTANVWRIADVVVALLFVVSFFLIRERES